MEFCGHILGQGKRWQSPGKLKALEKWERPRTVTELRSFLGFCNWYHDYVDRFAEEAAPLMNSLQVHKAEGKKGSKKLFKLTDEGARSFEDVKSPMFRKLYLNIITLTNSFWYARTPETMQSHHL